VRVSRGIQQRFRKEAFSPTRARDKNRIVKQYASVFARACRTARTPARHPQSDTISRRGRVGRDRVNYGGVSSPSPPPPSRIQLTTPSNRRLSLDSQPPREPMTARRTKPSALSARAADLSASNCHASSRARARSHMFVSHGLSAEIGPLQSNRRKKGCNVLTAVLLEIRPVERCHRF